MTITRQEAAAVLRALAFAESEGHLDKSGYEMIVRVMDSFPELKNTNLYEGSKIEIEYHQGESS